MIPGTDQGLQIHPCDPMSRLLFVPGQRKRELGASGYVGDSRETHFVGEFYHQLEILGEENGLPVARVHDYWKKRIKEGVEFRTLVQDDLVHPTVAGYRLMAEAVMQFFEGKDGDS